MLLCTVSVAQQLQVTGYIKQLATFTTVNQSFLASFADDPLRKPLLELFPKQSQDYQIHNRINVQWYGKAGFSGGLGMRNRLFWGFTPKNYAQNKDIYALLGVQSFAGLVDFDTYLNLGINWLESENAVLYSVFDRLWLQWENEKVRVRLGKQRINWGINAAFNPNDLFNQYNFFDFDYEERPGVDALALQYYINPYSSIEMAYAPARDSLRKSVGAMLYRLNNWGYDWQVLAGYFKHDVVLGVGWAGNIGNAGFKGEVSYFLPLQPLWSAQNMVASTTVDYSFKNGIYVMAGYIFNQDGVADASFENQIGLAGAQLSAKNLLPYKHTVMITGGYNITPLFRFDLSWLQTPDLANTVAVPSLTYALRTNLDLLLLGQIYLAHHPQTDQLGFFSSAIFTRIKFSF